MFERNGVSVDEHFVRSGGKSYAINKINSVEVREKKIPGKKGWIIAWVLALFLLLNGLGTMSDGNNAAAPLLIGLVCGAVGYKSFKNRHSSMAYNLYLMTSSSEVEAFATDDVVTVQDLRLAIEKAMIGPVAR